MYLSRIPPTCTGSALRNPAVCEDSITSSVAVIRACRVHTASGRQRTRDELRSHMYPRQGPSGVHGARMLWPPCRHPRGQGGPYPLVTQNTNKGREQARSSTKAANERRDPIGDERDSHRQVELRLR